MNAKLPSQDTMYDAFSRKDPSFEGIFFVGVKTTGIFCRPTCRARIPKRENIEFFPSTHDALLQGYRPCRRCLPLSKDGESPPWLVPLLDDIEARASESEGDIRIGDVDLRRRGIDPHRVRRWFKKHHGMTFQGYLRALRIGSAFGHIRSGNKVIEAAFDSGYESLSGFTETFKKTMGFPPKRSREKNVIAVSRVTTPLGPMLAGAVGASMCLLEFTDRRMLDTQLKVLRRRFEAAIIPGTSPLLGQIQKELDEYFAGSRKEFTIAVSAPGTAFQEKVWSCLRSISYGATRSYQEQARLIGHPEAVRAVGRANGENRIAILIPCHRVVGADGRLTGYGGGLWRKEYLLQLEAGNT